MHIEDIIHQSMGVGVKFNSWDHQLITSFYMQTHVDALGFTEKQGSLAVRILKKYLSQLNSLTGKDFTSYIENPTYKLGIRVVNYNKKISITKNINGEKFIKVEFPFDDKILQKIRNERANLNGASWNREEKSWIFSLDEASIKFLMSIQQEHNFVVDEEFQNYSQQIQRIIDECEKYLPMVVRSGEKLELRNAPKQIPEISGETLIEYLMEARKVGISTWDDDIEKELDSQGVDEFIKKFLKSSTNERNTLNKDMVILTPLTTILKYMSPTLFIIPGGSEMEKIALSLKFLQEAGVENSEISVLFRLPSDTGAEFNRYVKDNKLNSPINEKTKAVFISGKIPKTIFESKIAFNLIVNHSFYNVHYTIRDLVKWHHNVIHIVDSQEVSWTMT